MKILLIDVYNYNKGGAETVCFNTGKLLEKKGHDICYFTLKWEQNKPSIYSKYFPESKESRKGPLKHFKNLINYFYHREAAKKMQSLIDNEKPDIAHIHLIWGQISPSILPVLKRNNIPVILTVHDYRIICPAYAFRNGSGSICEKCEGVNFYNCFTNRCTKNSYILSLIMASEQYFRNYLFNPIKYIDGFIYVSSFAKEKHERYIHSIRMKPNIVLHNFTTLENAINVDKDDKLDNKYYIYIGRLSEEKGLNTLINAFSHLNQIKLKIVGSGPIEKELISKVKNKQYNNIEFLGYKTGDELKKIIQGAYFNIVPSEWYENNPMSIIESYAMGVPVIGSKIGGIPEIIEDDKTGFLFESGSCDSLRKIIVESFNLDKAKYISIKQNIKNYNLEKFDSEKYYLTLIDFYLQIIDLK